MLAMSPVAGRVEKRCRTEATTGRWGRQHRPRLPRRCLLEPTVWLVLVINVVIGIGIGLGLRAMPTLIMRAVPVTESGAANGLNTLMRALGTSIASAAVARCARELARQQRRRFRALRVGLCPCPALRTRRCCALRSHRRVHSQPPDLVGEEPALPDGVTPKATAAR